MSVRITPLGRASTVVALAALALIAVGCGGSGEAGNGIPQVQLATTTSGAPDAAPPTASTAPPLDESSAVEEELPFPRVVEHDAGTTEIPARPERIVAISGVADLDALLSLGVVPVGAAAYFPVSYDADFGFAPWNEEYWGAIDSFLIIPELRLEVVAAFEPDLIVGQPPGIDGAYEALSAIAPTVIHPSPSDWRTPLEMFGAALGREAEAEAAIAATEAELAQLAERVPESAPTIAMVVNTADGFVTVYTPDLGAGVAGVLEEIGVPSVDVESRLSVERLGDLADADHIVVYDFTLSPVDDLLDDPLFSQLPASQAGNVVVLDPEQSFSWIYETSRSLPIVVDGILTAIGL